MINCLVYMQVLLWQAKDLNLPSISSLFCARSSVWIERLPPEQKVRGSNPLGRTTQPLSDPVT